MRWSQRTAITPAPQTKKTPWAMFRILVVLIIIVLIVLVLIGK